MTATFVGATFLGPGFLWFERFKWLLSGMIDAKRPMDNVELSFDSPQDRQIDRQTGRQTETRKQETRSQRIDESSAAGPPTAPLETCRELRR